MKSYSIWVEPGGHQKGLTHKEQVRRIFEGYRMLESVANFKFTQTMNQFPSDRRIYFRDNAYMLKVGGSGKIPFGLFLKPSVFIFNKEREVNYWRKDSWTIQQLTGHEFIHSLPKWVQYKDDEHGHSNDRTSITNGNGGAKCPNPQDVYKLQRYAGKPIKRFWPRDKSLVGREVRASIARYDALWVVRLSLLALREGSTDPVFREKTQIRVLANVEDIKKELQILIAINKKWRKLRDMWQNVPMAA